MEQLVRENITKLVSRSVYILGSSMLRKKDTHVVVHTMELYEN
jgi:hypothetical protein